MFSFLDFKTITGNNTIDEPSYALILRAIFKILSNEYYIFVEESLAQPFNIYMTSGVTEYSIKAAPITSTLTITYDGEALVDGTDYQYYNDKLIIIKTITDYTIPLIITIDVGYTSSTMPDDLRYAIYKHAVHIYKSDDADVSVIQSVTDSKGDKVTYREQSTPTPVVRIYSFYSPKSPVII